MTLPILDFTPQQVDKDRGMEIKTWLAFNKDTYGVTHFCIIDDNVTQIRKVFPDNYVQTLYDNGFGETEYNKVMEILEI